MTEVLTKLPESDELLICPATGQPCGGNCEGPQHLAYRINGRPVADWDHQVCGKIRQPEQVSPTSMRSILGESAFRLMNMED